MNKILVSRNKIISDSNNILIEDNIIRILDDGIYFLEYDDIFDVELSIYIDKGNKVILYESCFLKDIRVNNKYFVNDGELIINKFYDNDSVLENIDIYLCSMNSKIDYNFSNICKNKESYVINIYHNCMKTNSNINNKSIAMDGSKLDFVINSIVGSEYVNSSLDQNTRIVTFGNSDCHISPNMYVDCDDIEARHGSVIGTFKDELIFYLMSRGITYNDSVKLLVKGYLMSNVNALGEIREKIQNSIELYWR